jgi:hypothetical protein
MATQTEQQFLDCLHQTTTTKAEAITALMSVFMLDRYYAEKEVALWYRNNLANSHQGEMK